MLRFNRSIIALLLTPILISAQTPKSASDGAVAKPGRGGVIAGRVTDSQGRPVVEERMRVNRLTSGGEAQPFYVGNDPDMFMTDDRGIYPIHGLPPGRYIVSAGYLAREGSIGYSTPRFFYPQTFYPNVTDEARAKVFELTEGAEFTGVDIVLADRKRSYDVYGRVVDADTGEPVPGVSIKKRVLVTENNPPIAVTIDLRNKSNEK